MNLLTLTDPWILHSAYLFSTLFVISVHQHDLPRGLDKEAITALCNHAGMEVTAAWTVQAEAVLEVV
jgi:hypothetical protein